MGRNDSNTVWIVALIAVPLAGLGLVGAAGAIAAFIWLSASASEQSGEEPTERTEAEARDPEARQGTTTEASGNSVRIEWANVEKADRCFFFSGPQGVGRDDDLGSAGTWKETDNAVKLEFGPQVVFTGRRQGERVVLRRRSTHDYEGDWRIDETITLHPDTRDRMSGDYRYEECNLGDPKECPGNCGLKANLSVTQLRSRQPRAP